MPGTREAKVRVAALVALVLLIGVALRGRLSSAQPADRAQPADNTASLLGLVALVTASLLVIVVSIVAALRDPQRAKQTAHYDVPGGGAVGARRSWRFVLVVLGVILAWLLVIALFVQVRLPRPRGGPEPTPSGSAPPGRGTGPRPPSPAQAADAGVIWYLVFSMAALLVVILAGMVLLRGRGRHRQASVALAADGTGSEPVKQGPGSLVLAAERGLAEVGDLSREPREAIIACYAAMELALASAPGAAPQESDTPSEVLARAVEHDAIHAGSATELVTLFAEARFSTHVMNEGHRESAERALRLVLDELRSPV
jgi:hypothetical protein